MHKIIYSLRILLYWFLSLRSRISCSVSPWLRLSAWLRFTRTQMQVLLFFCLLFLLLSSQVLRVSASELYQDATATITATFRPMFPTETPIPTKNYTCPTGQPSGAGTVTPSVYWQLQCAPCLDQAVATTTPFPVSTFMIPLTQTQQALVTPSVTPTGTSLPPTVAPSENIGFYFTTYCYGNNNSGTTCTLSNNNRTLHITTVGQYNPYGQEVDFRVAISPRVSLSVSPKLYYSANIAGSTAPSQRIGYNVSHGGGYVTGTSSTYTTTHSMWGQFDENIVVVYENYPTNVWDSMSIDLWVYLDNPAVPTMTPVPSPTSTPSGYCGSIIGTTSYGDGGGDFTLPVVTRGAISCPVSFDRITVPLYGVFGLPDITIPGVHICFEEVDFGTFLYYGVSINMNMLALIAAAGLVVTMFTRR